MSGPGLRSALVFGPLVLLLPLLWAVTDGRVKIEPVPWVGVAAVLAVGLWTAFAHARARWAGALLAALLGVAATHRLLFPGFPHGHDIITHLWGTYGFFRAILEGNPLPRWIHELGLGMPFLLFYPPLPFYLMLPFLALDATVYDAFKYGFIFYNALSGLSMFFVVNRWTGDRRAALVAAGAYCFAPYHLAESNYRVAVAEAAAMAVLPLFFYYVHRATGQPDRRNVALAATWTAVLTITHPLSLSMAGTGMGIWLLFAKWREGKRAVGRAVGLLFLIGLLGVSTAGYYSLPVAAEGRYVTIDDTLGSAKRPMYSWHGLYPQQLLERQLWTKWQKSEKRGSKEERDEMPFYFGLTLLVLIPVATRRGDPEAPKGLAAMTLGALALTLFPLDVALAWFPPMTMLQFPWRFLSIATCGAGLLAGFATKRLLEASEGRLFQRFVPAALFAVMVIDFFPYAGAATWRPAYTGVQRLSDDPGKLPFRVDHLDFPPADPRIELSNLRRVYPEYFTEATRKAFQRSKDDELQRLERAGVAVSFKRGIGRNGDSLNPAPYAEFVPAVGGPSRALSFERGGERIAVQLPGEPGTLVLKEQWFPGWVARIDHRELEVGETDDGLMELQLEADDTGPLRLHFSRTRWDRLAGLLLSSTCLVGLWWPIRRRGRAREEGGPGREEERHEVTG